MKKLIGIILMLVIIYAIAVTLQSIPFGQKKTEVGTYYIEKGVRQTGAVNIVTSVVLNYRGFDTLGEVTVLFIAAIGLGAIVFTFSQNKNEKVVVPSSQILSTGARLLFPLILVFGAYIFIHGHLSPGGGFQGGAIVASGFVLVYLASKERRVKRNKMIIVESVAGILFVAVGLLGLLYSGYFLTNFMPKGIANTLLSGGIIPILYIVIGFKVGSELAGVIADLIVK